MTATPGPRQMRCADSDRQLVVDVLNSAYAEGRITLEEHDERTSAAWSAKTFAELAETTGDLVPSQPIVPAHGAVAPTADARALVRTDGANDNLETIWSFLGSVRRDGYWRLRRRTQLNTVMGDIKLDLRNATLDAHECTINVMTIMGDVKIQVPEGLQVEVRVSNVLGSDKQSGMRPTRPDAPKVVITGGSLMGDVKIYGPDHVSLSKRLGLDAQL